MEDQIFNRSHIWLSIIIRKLFHFNCLMNNNDCWHQLNTAGVAYQMQPEESSILFIAMIDWEVDLTMERDNNS